MALFFLFVSLLTAVVQMGDGMQVWAKTAVRCLFDSYVVESLNNNLIAFELSVENLERALKSAQFSTNCTCKLTKKGGKPYLTFIVEIQAAQIMNVVQDVPVKLLSPAQAALILEPSVSADPREVNICLPSVGKVVRPIVDRLRKLDDVLVVEANMDGVLRLGVQTDRWAAPVCSDGVLLTERAVPRFRRASRVSFTRSWRACLRRISRPATQTSGRRRGSRCARPPKCLACTS